MNVKHIEAPLGGTINQAIEDAQRVARAEGVEVRFDFNGTEIRVQADSYPNLLLRDFFRAMNRYHAEPVGPHPPHTLSPETLRADADAEEAERRKSAARRAEYERNRAEKRARFEAEVEGVALDLSDAEAWASWVEANSDGYGSGVMRYAEAWARLMQARMAAGNELEAVAKQASHDADVEGITGFMYGCAVSMLAQAWAHGERLRRWHNLDAQIGDEGARANENGGTLNPALLNIG